MNFKKVLIGTGLSGLALGSLFAAVQIGTGSVVGTGAFDSPILWDETFGNTGNASGSVSNIKVIARVYPSLNMQISTGLIDLGVLVPNVASQGSLQIEVGTNAAGGVTVTARSQRWGLYNTGANSYINNLTTDGIAESYKFLSSAGPNDSSFADYTKTANLNAEVNDTTTDHVVMTTNKPEKTQNVDDVTFTVEATITDETPAGDYDDFITFTVSGNF